MKDKLILDDTTNFRDAIQLLDSSGKGVLPVVDKEGLFVGLITDGDIRRALLNNQLDIEHIINKNPHKLNKDTTKQQRLQFLKKIRRRHLPLIDANGKYVDMFILDDLDFNSKPNHVVIMAGGLGSRLGHLTENMPKPMLSIGGIPILETILSSFIERGFTKFYFSVNYLKEKIIGHFGDGEKWGVDIQYLIEEQRMGTGGALSLIDKQMEHPVLIINGDVLTSLDYSELLDFHLDEKSDGTMCVLSHEFTLPYGVVESENTKLLSLKEKPSISIDVNAGIYILNPEALKLVPENTYYDLPSLFEELISKDKNVKVYDLKDTWIDIGHADDYKRARDIFNI